MRGTLMIRNNPMHDVEHQAGQIVYKKPIVHYISDGFTIIKLGERALIYPVDHPSPWVTNGRIAHTSPIIRVGDDGEFETWNTIYKLKENRQ